MAVILLHPFHLLDQDAPVMKLRLLACSYRRRTLAPLPVMVKQVAARFDLEGRVGDSVAAMSAVRTRRVAQARGWYTVGTPLGSERLRDVAVRATSVCCCQSAIRGESAMETDSTEMCSQTPICLLGLESQAAYVRCDVAEILYL